MDCGLGIRDHRWQSPSQRGRIQLELKALIYQALEE
jgi:hypothetical protein